MQDVQWLIKGTILCQWREFPASYQDTPCMCTSRKGEKADTGKGLLGGTGTSYTGSKPAWQVLRSQLVAVNKLTRVPFWEGTTKRAQISCIFRLFRPSFLDFLDSSGPVCWLKKKQNLSPEICISYALPQQHQNPLMRNALVQGCSVRKNINTTKLLNLLKHYSKLG